MAKLAKVLFVDDDKNILQINRVYFEARGFDVRTADNAADALELVAHEPFDCLVLDVILPAGGDGYQLCRQIRELTNTPIIFLTSLTEQDFLYQGFNAGGDDYVTKPYDLWELLLRVRSRVRQSRAGQEAERLLSYPPLTIVPASRRATMGGQFLALTGGEFDILALLAGPPQKGVSLEEIYRQVRKMPSLEGTHTVQVHISHLRRKLEAAYNGHKYIQTSWGKGYYFAPPPES